MAVALNEGDAQPGSGAGVVVVVGGGGGLRKRGCVGRGGRGGKVVDRRQ